MHRTAYAKGQLLPISALAICLCCCFFSCVEADDVYIEYGEWNTWGFCTEQCVQYRRRTCVSKGFLWPCRNVFQRQNCFTDNCRRTVEVNLSALDCGRRRNLPPILRIFGGKESQPHSWPWHVSLVRSRNSHDQFCGGTLVHPQFVLTARHCVATSRYTSYVPNVFAVVGDHDTRLRQPNERTYRVTKIRTHPSLYQGNLEYDVALLKLEEPVVLSDHVRLACLPQPQDRVAKSPVNTMCTAIGFGRQGRGGYEPMSPTLREANLYLTKHEQCDREYQSTNVRINPHSHVCAAAAGRDTCSGDSGGGLFCAHQPDPPSSAGSGGAGAQERWYLFGITSFGHPRGCGYHSGVFQRTSILFNWVQDSINSDLRESRRL